MNKRYALFFIVFAVAILVLGAYTYFSHGLSAEGAAPISSGSSVASSSGTTASNQSSNDKITEDTAFLSTLTSLTRLKINTSLFSNKVFNSLRDNTVILEQGSIGRTNPFAPIASTPVSSQSSAPLSPVITNEATSVTAKSATLNGALGDSAGVTSTYFEYGLAPGALTFTTAPSKQSLIGTFITNVTGLKSGTAYFYHAAAKINGTVRYGDIVSFTTL